MPGIAQLAGETAVSEHFCQSIGDGHFRPRVCNLILAQQFRDMLRSHVVVACPSQIVEDCFAAMKTAQVLKGSHRMSKVQRSMFMPLREKTITQRHSWQTPSTVVLCLGGLAMWMKKYGWRAHQRGLCVLSK